MFQYNQYKGNVFNFKLLQKTSDHLLIENYNLSYQHLQDSSFGNNRDPCLLPKITNLSSHMHHMAWLRESVSVRFLADPRGEEIGGIGLQQQLLERNVKRDLMHRPGVVKGDEAC